MAEHKIPAAMRAMPAEVYASGELRDGWFTEGDQGASRWGIKVQRTLHEETSPFQTIHVYESTFFGRMLTLDNLLMFTERDEFVYHEMLAHVPLCSLPQPRSVLIIGGGDCGCAREVLKHACVERVVQCDIDERVTRVSAQYFPWVKPTCADPRLELTFANGVELVGSTAERFDLVIVDSTDPIGEATPLFLADFYRAVARVLTPGGVMVAQTESPHWDADMVGAIYNQIRHGFDQVSAYLGWVPSYASGCWSWAYASNGRQPDTYFDAQRAEEISRSTRYYNPEIHRAAFALPNFAKQAVREENPFAALDQAHRRLVGG